MGDTNMITPTIMIFLLGLTLFFANAAILDNATAKVIPDSTDGITLSLLNRHENDALTKRVTLAPASDFTITVADVPQDIWFIVLQIHTFQYNVTLAYDKAALNKVSNGSLFGSNNGLYLKTRNVTGPIQVFLAQDNVHDIDGLLVIVPYGRNAPIPGGCNMEFDIEIAPYQKLYAGNETITVDTQPGSVLAPANESPLLCEKQLVHHRMYRLYLPKQDFTPDTYFKAIASMLTPQDIVRNGDEMPFSVRTTSMRHVYNAYTGVGSVYAAVATYGNHSSAYVPVFTYACSPLLYPDDCQILNSTLARVICTLTLIIGLFLLSRGHRYAHIDCYLSNIMISIFLVYPIVVITDNSLSFVTTNLLVTLITTVFIVALWMIVRYFNDTFAVMVSFVQGLSMGLLCACVTYLYAPAPWFRVMENDESFWFLFVGIMILVAALLMVKPCVADAFKRTVFGSLFVILPIDYFTEGSLKYIFIATLRRILVPGFHSAFVYPPFQGADKALVALWFLLMIMRFVAQYLHHSRNEANRKNQNNPERASLLPRNRPDYASVIVARRSDA